MEKLFHEISLSNLLTLQQKENHTIIDVRSPQEFQDASIPGSINIPVFDNAERAEIGTIYKQVGAKEASEKGLEIFSKKLPTFIAQFKDLKQPFTVYCWRGGMRSKTAATVLDLMGYRVNRLTGGIRTYRQWVVHELENYDLKSKLIVLNGCTGSGKTAILNRLATEHYPVINLEEMAGHRGSIFGQIGLTPTNQTRFDSLLLTELLRFQDAPYIFIEGESRRIGKVSMPQFLFDAKENGLHFMINLPIEVRVQNILDEYKPWEYPQFFIEAFLRIKKRIHTPIAKQIEEDLKNGHYPSVIKLLLEYYYDPKYRHSGSEILEQQKITIDALDVDDAFQKVLTEINKLPQ